MVVEKLSLKQNKVMIETLKTDVDTFKATVAQDIKNSTSLTITKSNKDANKIYTTVEYRTKSNNKLYAISTLSGGTSPNYTTRTLKLYNADGVTVKETLVYTLTYDADGDLISEI